MSEQGSTGPHAARRSSAPGTPWLGDCTICGQTGLTQAQAAQDCPGKSDQIRGLGAGMRSENPDDLRRRRYRDRGDSWAEIDGGDTSVSGAYQEGQRYAYGSNYGYQGEAQDLEMTEHDREVWKRLDRDHKKSLRDARADMQGKGPQGWLGTVRRMFGL